MDKLENTPPTHVEVPAISEYDYPLPEERIAKFPPSRREDAKLLIWRNGTISEQPFEKIGSLLPADGFVVFNNTKVVRARIVMHKPGGGARIEVFCLEPHEPADYERAFAVHETCIWKCMIGNAKKWKTGAIEADGLQAYKESANIVRFEWNSNKTFGEVLEELGRMPIPPYLNRESEAIDDTRYQTVYSRIEGSVAAPTAGLHFTPEIIAALPQATGEVTLHVGAGTFLPVKANDPREHTMHTEHFEVSAELIDNLIKHAGKVTAVGTTTVRTLESLVALGLRILHTGSPEPEKPVGQWELYNGRPDNITTQNVTEPVHHEFSSSSNDALTALRDWMLSHKLHTLKAATQIMIMPGYRFQVVNSMFTNFHQPQSTLLLLVSAFVGGGNKVHQNRWREIYDYALANDFRFLSYGDSSLLLG